jgi:hypothetical protein
MGLVDHPPYMSPNLALHSPNAAKMTLLIGYPEVVGSPRCEWRFHPEDKRHDLQGDYNPWEQWQDLHLGEAS